MDSQQKSSVDEIRQRFDNDVERLSNLETGQSATVDAVKCLELISQAAATATPHASSLLDLGCGAGNFSLRLLQELPELKSVTLVDLSQPMLQRATERIQASSPANLNSIQSDLRNVELNAEQYDVVLAGAVLHHLRTEQEWEETFAKIFQSVRPGGSFWIFDLVSYANDQVHALMWNKYGDYLEKLRDEEYRDHVFAYIDQEDSPRPLYFQLKQLEQAGFQQIDVLHSNTCFAAFGGIRT